MKAAKMTNLHSTNWKQWFRSSDPRKRQNDENGGCHSGKGMVWKKRVCSSLKMSDVSEPVVWGTCGLHPEFLWFSVMCVVSKICTNPTLNSFFVAVWAVFVPIFHERPPICKLQLWQTIGFEMPEKVASLPAMYRSLEALRAENREKIVKLQRHCLIGSSQKKFAVIHSESSSCLCSNAWRPQRSKSRSIIRSGHLAYRFWSCSFLLGILSLISTW